MYRIYCESLISTVKKWPPVKTWRNEDKFLYVRWWAVNEPDSNSLEVWNQKKRISLGVFCFYSSPLILAWMLIHPFTKKGRNKLLDSEYLTLITYGWIGLELFWVAFAGCNVHWHDSESSRIVGESSELLEEALCIRSRMNKPGITPVSNWCALRVLEEFY